MSDSDRDSDRPGRPGFFRRHTSAVVVSLVAGLPLLGGAPFWVPWVHEKIDLLLPEPERPHAAPLPANQFVVPLGIKDAEDLFVVDGQRHRIVRPLTTGGTGAGAPTLTSDRTTVLYTDRNGQAYAVSTDGSSAKLFMQPDDKCGFIRHISTARLDPNHLVLDCRPPAPAGMKSVQDFFQFVDLRGLVIQTLRPTSSRVDDASLSPDGSQVAYWGSDDLTGDTDGGAVFTITTDGKNRVERRTDGRRGVDADPAWNFDGTRIAYRHRTADGSVIQVLSTTTDAEPKTVVSSTRYNFQKPSWSVTDDQIAAVRSGGDTGLKAGPYRIVVAQTAGTSKTYLTTPSYPSIFAPVWGGR